MQGLQYSQRLGGLCNVGILQKYFAQTQMCISVFNAYLIYKVQYEYKIVYVCSIIVSVMYCICVKSSIWLPNEANSTCIIRYSVYHSHMCT